MPALEGGALIYAPSRSSVKGDTSVEKARDSSRDRATMRTFGDGSGVTMTVVGTVMVVTMTVAVM